MVIEKDEISRWFPDTVYYRQHAERLAYSFSRLPALKPGFSCLSIGSWGAESPLLTNVLGAERVVCVRAPDQGVPRRERRIIQAPNALGECEAELHALNLETEPLPADLEAFDMVLMWEVIEHLCIDPAFMVAQAIKALKPRGVISITTPNALWHVYTTAQLFGVNALGLKLQHHKPFATHWRLYSPAEVAELTERMGCELGCVDSFLNEAPFSLKSRILQHALQFMRRKSGNGRCSFGQFVYVLAEKHRDAEIYRPQWLYPRTGDEGGQVHLRQHAPAVTIA
ncbi:MAG TPA: methyltransferase domain-containing protein [Pirellulales bacterium]|nr:methyltransferase domain-containing protein [Pirellulales bacterium]